MRHVIAIATLALGACTAQVAPEPASAAPPQTEAPAEAADRAPPAEDAQESSKLSPQETCKSYANLSKTIMGARQAGASMAEMMQIADGDKLQEEIIIEAFDKPRMNLEENRREMAVDFENEIYLQCIKQLR